VDKVVNGLHIKPNDAKDHSKWEEMFRENWSDSTIDIAVYKLYVSGGFKGVKCVYCFVCFVTGLRRLTVFRTN